MKDVNLNSGIIYLVDDLPQETKKLMVLYDNRGWAIRCYDKHGNKLTTMIPDDRLGSSDADTHLVRQENL